MARVKLEKPQMDTIVLTRAELEAWKKKLDRIGQGLERANHAGKGEPIKEAS